MAFHLLGEGMRNRLLLILGVCLIAAAVAQASPITYTFNGTVSGWLGASDPTSGPITGWLTVDNTTGLLQDFSFTLPQLGGLNPWYGTSYVATTANSYISVNQSMEFQIQSYNLTYWDSTILNLDFDSLPGATHTGAGPESSLLQAPLSGGDWTFLADVSGTATAPPSAEVPEPPTALLLAGGLLLAGLFSLGGARRRRAFSA